MYKMSWPDLAGASAAMVSRALLPVKRSIWTSTFSFAAHSWINASEVLLAPGTKWSQKPIESLPAACVVLTNGAAIIADAAADVAMNRRRVNMFLFIVFAPFHVPWQQAGKKASGKYDNSQPTNLVKSAAPRLVACIQYSAVRKSICEGASLAMSGVGVRRGKAALSSGCKSHPANAPAGSNRSSHGGNEMAEAFGIARHELVTARVCRP